MKTLVAAVLTLAGCAHMDVQDMANGQHFLTAISASGGYYGSHEEAVENANAFCERRDRQTEIGSFFDHSAVGPHGEHTSTLIFSCVNRKSLQF